MIFVILMLYIGIFCSIPTLRSMFLGNQSEIFFFILIPVHIAMIPLTITTFINKLKKLRKSLSFCIGAIATAFILFMVTITMMNNVSDRGMGTIVFLLFPLVQAVVAFAGIISGVFYIIKAINGRASK